MTEGLQFAIRFAITTYFCYHFCYCFVIFIYCVYFLLPFNLQELCFQVVHVKNYVFNHKRQGTGEKVRQTLLQPTFESSSVPHMAKDDGKYTSFSYIYIPFCIRGNIN